MPKYSGTMHPHKHGLIRWTAAILIAVCLAGVSVAAEAPRKGQTDEASAYGPPVLSSADQTYLIRLIRASLAALAEGAKPGEPRNASSAVRRLRCPVVVTLRRGGYPLALGQADGQDDVATSSLAAARMAYEGCRPPLSGELLQRLSVEVELLGPAERLSVGLLSRRRLAKKYVPGLDGVAVRLGERNALIRPSQIIAWGFSTADVLTFIEERLGLSAAELNRRKGEAICLRFQTLHFWQPGPKDPTVELRCGTALVPPEEVTSEHLQEVARRLARYLKDRQRPNGTFRYSYVPAQNRFEETSPVMDDAGAAWALASFGRVERDTAARAAAVTTINHLIQDLRPYPAEKATSPGRSPSGPTSSSAAYLRAPGQGDRLGSTAMLLLACAEVQPVTTYRPVRDRLTAAILALQMPTGMLETNFVTTRASAPQDLDPGQALLALAKAYRVDHAPGAMAGIDNAFDHYEKQFSVRPTAALVPWHASAYATIALSDPRPRYIDQVFQMIDWLIQRQLTSQNCGQPLMIGGIDPLGQDLAGITTALHMSAVADALTLARRVGKSERAERYRRALQLGTRFVLQLRFRPEECYYVRSRVDTVDGVRTTPWDHTLTIENSSLALTALLKAREALFP
jgi:AMMECR1 domain-containing protein